VPPTPQALRAGALRRLLDQLVWATQISAGFCGHITSRRDMSDPESRKRCALAPCGALL